MTRMFPFSARVAAGMAKNWGSRTWMRKTRIMTSSTDGWLGNEDNSECPPPLSYSEVNLIVFQNASASALVC